MTVEKNKNNVKEHFEKVLSPIDKINKDFLDSIKRNEDNSKSLESLLSI